MRSFKRLLTGGILITIWSVSASAQQLTLPDAIRIAQENSYDAQLARFSFLASYWTYRSFKAELLPSVNLNGGLANFDHSLVAVRNYEDGQVAYVNNNSMTNHLTLSLDQQIAATGGRVSHGLTASLGNLLIFRFLKCVDPFSAVTRTLPFDSICPACSGLLHGFSGSV